MSYNCEIIADSTNPQGDRITTMKIRFPRFILAEFNTHRMFSRNSASSRAIPFKKMVKMVEENPFIPIAWQKDHKGMQGTEYLTDLDEINGQVDSWLKARNEAVHYATELNQDGGVTKQLCNRLLEPFMWHEVIVTATEWENFFKLRCPQYRYIDNIFRSKNDIINYFEKNKMYGLPRKDLTVEWLKMNESQAEIHIQAIAELMWDAYNESTPKQLETGDWHIPFGDQIDFVGNLVKSIDVNNTGFKDYQEQNTVKIATARCARISYQTLGDNPKIDYEADIKLHDILTSNGHASPLEHIAKAMSEDEYSMYRRDTPDDNQTGWCRNFKGFIQYRHLTNL